MNKEAVNTGFWRGFTWKRFGRYILIALAYFIIEPFIDAIFSDQGFAEYITLKRIVGTVIKALFFAFLFAIWFEPSMAKKQSPQKK